MTFQFRPYQLEAIDLAASRRSLLIAMTMGSGKTATTVGTVMKLRAEKKVTSGLVFVLNSTKYQWLREIKKVDPSARAIVIDGDKRTRQTQYRHSKRYHYVILHYECLVNDWDDIKAFCPVDFIVSDECTAIKSFVAKRSKRLKALGKKTPYKFALSGQPVENRPEELFSIMEFVDPDVLGDFQKFDRTFIERDYFGRPTRYRNLETLHNAMRGAMFRKSREDIKEWLPEMIVTEVPVPLDPGSLKLHDRIKRDLLAKLDEAIVQGGFNLISHYGRGDKGNHAKGDVMSRLLALRMLASHPSLLTKSADDFDDPDTSSGSQYASDLAKSGALANLSTKSAKLDALVDLVEEILDEDPSHKVVIFSYFKPMLVLIGEAIQKRCSVDMVKITGDVPAGQRDTFIQRFNNNPACRVFLSSDAGAYGVDLHKGSHLVCVKADMPVLTHDLRWVSAGSLGEGDGILGCEEYPRQRGQGYSRRWQRGEVLRNIVVPRECVSVNLSNGESLIVTPEHRFLARNLHGSTLGWVEAQHLQPRWLVPRYLDVWSDPSTFDDGWVSGILDGEGCVAKVGHGLAVSVTQNRGPVLDRVLALTKEAGFALRDTGREGKCPQYVVQGGKAEAMRFLGTYQPMRLVQRWGELVENHLIQSIERSHVVSVTPAGLHDVAVLGTSTRTFVGAGYMMHNCYDLPWSAGTLAQRVSRIDRTSSAFSSINIFYLYGQGTIEERMFNQLQQKMAVAGAFLDGKYDLKSGSLPLDFTSLRQFLLDS